MGKQKFVAVTLGGYTWRRGKIKRFSLLRPVEVQGWKFKFQVRTT